MKIECIKGLLFDCNSILIMQGEVFKLSMNSDCDEIMLFEAVEGGSLNPGMELEFTNEELCENFKFIG